MKGVLLLLVALGTPVMAQTTDPVFAGWDWRPSELGSRPAGLGGAYVAVADGLRAAVANPAGLTLVPQGEVNISGAPLWAAGTVGHGFGRLRFGLYFARTEPRAVRRDDLSFSTGLDEHSDVVSRQAEAGAAAGFRVSRLRLGCALAWGQTSMTAIHALNESSPGSEETRVAFRRDHLGAVGGALFDVLGAGPNPRHTLRVGASYRRGVDWNADRTHVTVGGGPSTAVTTTVVLRQPSSLTIGVALRGPAQLAGAKGYLLSLQADRTALDELLHALRHNLGPDPDKDAFDFGKRWGGRAGAEFDFESPIGGVLKFRAGVARGSPARLHYSGTAPRLQALFGAPLEHEVSLSAGASLIAEYMDNGLRLDLDLTGLRRHADPLRVSFGVVYRF